MSNLKYKEMQIFVPYPEPIKVAQCMDKLRLNKQIIECGQIINAIKGTGKGWFNHPVVKMYKDHVEWLEHYKNCLEAHRDALNSDWDDGLGHIFLCVATENEKANEITPPFLTEEFCIQHRRRLYTKNPEYYKQFAEYGKSEENWYYIGDEIVKYINGKRIE